MNVEAIEEASSCLQKVADNVKELVESENGIATILNDHRSYLADPTIPIYAKLLSKHSMTNTKELEKIMKKQAYFFGERGKCSVPKKWNNLFLNSDSRISNFFTIQYVLLRYLFIDKEIYTVM